MIIEDYKIFLQNAASNQLRRLGIGSQSMIYSYPKYKCAVKMLLVPDSHEIEVLKRLNHENIIKLIGILTDNNGLLLELSDNGDLGAYLGNNKHMTTESNKLVWVKGIFEGLRYMHSMDVIHNDIKCSNILLFTNKLHPKISDFGSANKDEFEGSIRWCSLSRLRGESNPSTDWYSFGVTVWQIYNDGKLPYESVEDDDQVEAIIERENKNNCISLYTNRVEVNKILATCYEFKDVHQIYEEIYKL